MISKTDRVIETPRLFMRRMTSADLPAITAIFADPEVMRFYQSGVRDRAATEAWLRRNLERYAREGVGLYALIHQDSGELAGHCGFIVWELSGRRELEIAYCLAKKFWGHGFASEAANACRQYAFATLGERRVISIIHHRNEASARVAIRNGMRVWRRTEIKGTPVVIYAAEATPPDSDTASKAGTRRPTNRST